MSSNAHASVSVESLEEDMDSREEPVNGFDSSAALILVPEGEDDDEDAPEGSPNSSHSPFDISNSDDEELGFASDSPSTSSATSLVPPMSSLTVFLYLFAPFLRLGALLIPSSDPATFPLPLHTSVPALLVFAGLTVLTRQVWYMLARYVRQADLEEIILETFARQRSKEERRRFLRLVVKAAVGLVRVLVAAVYLRASVDALLAVLPQKLVWLPARITMTFIQSIILAPLYFAPSLNATKVVSATWVSVAAYTAWLVCTSVAHSRGTLAAASSVSDSLGSLWESIPIIAFTFTTTSTIPLYASLKATKSRRLAVAGSPKPGRAQSFKLLSLLSVLLAVAMVLPLAFFNAPPATSPPTTTSPTLRLALPIFSTLTLLLSIPSVLLTTPPLPIPSALRRNTNFPISKFLVFVLSVGLAMVPKGSAKILSDALMILAFLSTYVVPALIHITLHNFRRPLSILIPRTPLPTSQSESRADELLQRKERTLQRKRLGRRLVWDIGVWVLLVPVGGGGLVWAVGRLAGRW